MILTLNVWKVPQTSLSVNWRFHFFLFVCWRNKWGDEDDNLQKSSYWVLIWGHHYFFELFLVNCVELMIVCCPFVCWKFSRFWCCFLWPLWVSNFSHNYIAIGHYYISATDRSNCQWTLLMYIFFLGFVLFRRILSFWPEDVVLFHFQMKPLCFISLLM